MKHRDEQYTEYFEPRLARLPEEVAEQAMSCECPTVKGNQIYERERNGNKSE